MYTCLVQNRLPLKLGATLDECVVPFCDLVHSSCTISMNSTNTCQITTAVITHLELSTIAALVRYVAKIIVVAESVQDFYVLLN